MQSMHAVGASSSLVQREECHHLAPADTSILLQSACVWRDAAADLCKLQCRYLVCMVMKYWAWSSMILLSNSLNTHTHLKIYL